MHRQPHLQFVNRGDLIARGKLHRARRAGQTSGAEQEIGAGGLHHTRAQLPFGPQAGGKRPHRFDPAKVALHGGLIDILIDAKQPVFPARRGLQAQMPGDAPGPNAVIGSSAKVQLQEVMAADLPDAAQGDAAHARVTAGLRLQPHLPRDQPQTAVGLRTRPGRQSQRQRKPQHRGDAAGTDRGTGANRGAAAVNRPE